MVDDTQNGGLHDGIGPVARVGGFATTPAEVALVDTTGSLLEAIPNDHQFDHMIVHLPDIGFIDPTVKTHLHLGLAPSGLGDSTALILRAAGSQLVPIPAYPAPGDQIRIQRRCRIDNTDLVVEERVSIGGYSAGHLRAILRASDAHHERSWFMRLLDRHWRNVELLAFTAGDEDAVREPLLIEVRYRLIDAVAGDADDLTVRLPAIWEDYYIAFQQVHRRYRDFHITFPIDLASETTLVTPTAYKPVIDAERSADPHTEQALAWSSQARVEEDLHIALQATLETGRYPAESYRRFVRSCIRAVASIGPTVRLERDD